MPEPARSPDLDSRKLPKVDAVLTDALKSDGREAAAKAWIALERAGYRIVPGWMMNEMHERHAAYVRGDADARAEALREVEEALPGMAEALLSEGIEDWRCSPDGASFRWGVESFIGRFRDRFRAGGER